MSRKPLPENVPPRGTSMESMYWFPVVSGRGRDAVVLTYAEIDKAGSEVGQIPEGEWFAGIWATGGGTGMEIVSGWVQYQGVGATCLRLNRGDDNKFWVAKESKVIRIPTPEWFDWDMAQGYETVEVEDSEAVGVNVTVVHSASEA